MKKKTSEDLAKELKELSKAELNGEIIENPTEEEQKIIKAREVLDKAFEKADKAAGDKKLLERKKIELELELEKNDIFKQYQKVLQDIEKLDKVFEDMKQLTEEAEIGERSLFEGKNINVTYKASYDRRGLNSEAFFEDFSPKSRMYQKYVKLTRVKGSFTIKFKEK